MPDEYVSTDCRTGHHQRCQEEPAVRCACECHMGQWPWVERRKLVRKAAASPPARRRRDD